MIVDTVKCKVKEDNGEFEYIYNLVENKLSLEMCKDNILAYGVEVQSFIKTNGKMVMVDKEEVKFISPYKYKVKEFMSMLEKNLVSPIHLIDIVEEVIEDYYLDFDNISKVCTSVN